MSYTNSFRLYKGFLKKGIIQFFILVICVHLNFIEENKISLVTENSSFTESNYIINKKQFKITR